MDIQFKKIRMPGYCLVTVIILVAALAYAANQLKYRDVDGTVHTLYQYLLENIAG